MPTLDQCETKVRRPPDLKPPSIFSLPFFWNNRACNTDPTHASQNKILRLFEFLAAYNCILWAPWLATYDILMAIDATPVSVHGVHTMLLHASRNSDGLSFSMYNLQVSFLSWSLCLRQYLLSLLDAIRHT